MNKNQAKRIAALAKRIRRGPSGDATALIKDHARRHRVSVSTGYRDFEAAIDKLSWRRVRQ